MTDDTLALGLQWVYGLSNVPSNIVNLSNEHNDRVCYVAGHTAVLYDKRTRKQTFLQGHCRLITAVAASQDRSLLITADQGSNSMLVFWDPVNGQPIRTLQQPHAAGVIAIAVSPDASQMATLSAVAGPEDVQEIALWDLRPLTASMSSTPMQPVAVTPVPAGDTQLHVCYNPDDMTELLSNGARRAYFWRSQLPGTRLLSYYSPPMRASDFHQAVGDYVTSVFVPGSKQALTSTVDGDVVVWDEQGSSAQMGTRATDRRAIKVMRLHGTAINHLSCIGDFVVSGGADGLVRLYDSMLRMSAWFEDLGAVGAVTCVSFATKGQPRPQAEMQLNRLSAPNFMVSTSNGSVLSVSADTFNTPDPDKPSGAELLVKSPPTTVTDIGAHPLKPELLLLDAKGGEILRWNLPDRCCVQSKRLPNGCEAANMLLARDASIIAIGCSGGQVVLLKGDTLEEIIVLRNTKHKIHCLSISSSGQHVAAADESGMVLLYGFVPYKGTFYKWDFVGKYKAHHKNVVGLHFGEAPSGQTRLFSLGADRRLLEYDLATAGAANAGLRTRAVLDVVAPGGAGHPCSMCFAPPMPYYSANSMDTLLLVADDAKKIKAYNPDTRTACATYLGPTFGGVINKLLPFRSVTDNGAWLAYGTPQQVVGLVAWPLDGNPEHSMGVIAHPGDIKAMALSFDGRKLITLGEQGVLNIWDVNTTALGPIGRPLVKTAADSAWSQLIGDKALLEELKDYFCYAQLLSEQQDATGAHQVNGNVPISALPALMRAAGYYPSNSDIDNLLAHVKFLAGLSPDTSMESTLTSISGAINSSNGTYSSAGADTGSRPGSPGAGPKQHVQQAGKNWELDGVADTVDFETFLCLYVNHRPLAEVAQEQLREVFATLGASSSTEQLLDLLQQGGEAMSPAEMQHVFQVLTGAGKPTDALPDAVDAGWFMSEVLGFQ
eukprot:gene11389-11537_t